MRFRPAALAAVLVTIFIGCADDPQAPLEPDVQQAIQSTTTDVSGQVPPRSAGYGAEWLAMSDSAMWQYIVAHDTLVNVGLKMPGAVRGIWREQILVSAVDLLNGRLAIGAIPGLEVVKDLVRLPAVQVRVGSETALGLLRALPTTDYVEPNWLGGGYLDSGCDYNPFTPTNPPTTFAGDTLPIHYTGRDADIELAWNRTNGAGIAIGITDTGISANQDELLTRFDDSHSAGRWYLYRGVGTRSWQGTCSHGTRMAGVAAAPMNGSNMVGVAWGAHLVSANQADGVIAINGDAAVAAIDIAAQDAPAGQSAAHRIVTMAWQSNDSNVISDEIRYWHGFDRLFIAASGSVDYPGIAFPADMIEVIAVSAVGPGYSEIAGLNYGDDVELTFPVDQLSNGQYTGDFNNLGGTSGASAAVSGIAALIWSYYPADSNLDIRQRLREAAHNYPSHGRVVGYGVPNAMKAVGGMHHVQIGGASDLLISESEYVTHTAQKFSGDGPFTYLWDNGTTGSSITFEYPAPEPGEVDFYNYWVTVTDQSDGATITAYKTLRVEGCSMQGGHEFQCDM